MSLNHQKTLNNFQIKKKMLRQQSFSNSVLLFLLFNFLTLNNSLLVIEEKKTTQIKPPTIGQCFILLFSYSRSIKNSFELVFF